MRKIINFLKSELFWCNAIAVASVIFELTLVISGYPVIAVCIAAAVFVTSVAAFIKLPYAEEGMLMLTSLFYGLSIAMSLFGGVNSFAFYAGVVLFVIALSIQCFMTAQRLDGRI